MLKLFYIKRAYSSFGCNFLCEKKKYAYKSEMKALNLKDKEKKSVGK